MLSFPRIRAVSTVAALALLATACSLTGGPSTPELILLSATPEPLPTNFPTAVPPATALPSPTPTVVIEATSTDTPTPVLPTAIPTNTPVPMSPTPEISSYLGGRDGGVYVRNAPGTGSEVTQIVNGNAPLTLIGRTEDFRWVEVIFDAGNSGWVAVDDVVTQVDLNTLAITGVPNNGAIFATVQINSGGLRLREQPSTVGNVIVNLAALERLNVEGRLESGDWLQVATDGGYKGWVMTQYVDLGANLEDVPIVGAQLITVDSVFGGEVIAEGDGLRMRDIPSLYGSVLANLDSFTPVSIIGRTDDNTWLQIRTPDGGEGWVWAAYLRVRADLASIPVTGEAEIVELQPAAAGSTGDGGGHSWLVNSGAPPAPSGVVSGITGTARQIYVRGQSLGNRANVFSKVGDSITATPYMFGPIGWNDYNLGEHSYLQPVIQYFQNANARDGNSFVNGSYAAQPGWSTPVVLNAEYADKGACLPDEVPLVCEYRIVKPSIALIMLGTNDIDYMPGDLYRYHLQRIVEISIDHGVIPVLSTIPERVNHDVGGFNAIIIETAWAYDVPVWDLWRALLPLPNQGRADDGIHLSSPPPGTYGLAADFRPEHMAYGYVVRNFTALQVLDAVWRQVIMAG